MQNITLVITEDSNQYAINLDDTIHYEQDIEYLNNLKLAKYKIDSILLSHASSISTEKFNIAMKLNPDFDGNNNFIDDKERLTSQCKRIFDLMKDGKWRTLDQISLISNDPPASISARLRDLRKPKFGSFIVNKRLVANGLWEYQLEG